MGMGAVIEAAIARYLEDFGEIMCHFGSFKVDRAKGLDTRSIDDSTAAWKIQQFAEGGRVHALVMGLTHVTHSDMSARHQQVDDRRFAHTTIARKQRHFTGQHIPQRIGALTSSSRQGDSLIANRLIESLQLVEPYTQFFGNKQIHLVESEHGWYLIGLGCGEETIDKGGTGHGIGQCNHKHSLVQVGGNDLELLGEIAGAADYVVAPRLDGTHYRSVTTLVLDLYSVSYGNRIGAAHPLEA